MYNKRVYIQDENGILNELVKHSSLYKRTLKNAEIWTIDEFRERIKDTADTLFYAIGHEFYESLRDMNDDGTIHLGLRKFSYIDFQDLQFVHIGQNRLIYDPAKEFYEYKAEEGRVTKKWFFSQELLDENLDCKRPRLDYFLSDECEQVYLEYPKTKIVGLREGKTVLQRLDEFTIHKYDTTVDYDWYRNPENRVWENEFGFDFETFNSKKGSNLGKAFPEFDGVRCAGFALSWCDPYSNKPKAIFFDFRKDYGYDETVWENNPQYKKEYYEFLEVMKSFFDHHYKHIWAYNASFEYAMLFSLLRKFYYIQDAYALCIADDRRSSLKFNVQYYLRSPSWDDELDADFEYFRQICGNFANFNEFKAYEATYIMMHDNSDAKNSAEVKEELKAVKEKEKEQKKAIRDKYGLKAKADAEEIQQRFEKTKVYDKLQFMQKKYDFFVDLEKKDPRFIEAMSFFSEENPDKRMLLEQHWGDEWGATGVLSNTTEYGTKEENCLGLYCGIDAFCGERLARLLMPAYGNNCYQEILNHRYIGAELKMCGIKVDKKKLLELYRFCWNVDNNYELSSNIFAQKLSMQNINPFHVELYNKLNDTQKYWLKKYPYYFKGGKDWAGAAIVLDTYRRLFKKYKEEQDYSLEGYVPIKEIYQTLGKTCSDAKAEEIIDDYELKSFTVDKFNEGDKHADLSESSRKKHCEFRERIGRIALKVINIGPVIKEINEFALGLFRKDYLELFYDQTAVYWIYEDKLPFNKTKVFCGENKGSPVFVNLFELIDDDSAKAEKMLAQYFPEVDEKMLEDLRELPSDLLDKFTRLVPLNDDNYINEYIDKYSWEDWVPDLDQVLGEDFVNSLPSYYYFKQDMNVFKLNELIYENVGDTNINMYENLRDKNEKLMMYPKELVLNYFSPEQIDDFFYDFVKKYGYFDYGLATRSVANCFDIYCQYKGIEPIDISKADSKELWKAMLEFLNNEEYRDIIVNTPKFSKKYLYTSEDSESDKEEYDWFGKPEKGTGYVGIDTVYNLDKWNSKDALDDCCKVYKLIPYLFNTNTGIYNFFKVDGNILPPIIDEVLNEYDEKLRPMYREQLSKLWDLFHQGFIRQLASTCHKLLTTYIPAIDMGYKKYPYKENLDNTGNDTLYGTWEYFEEYQLTNIMNEDNEKTYKGVEFLYSEDCDKWWLEEVPDMWCLPPYSINTVISKRNSSPFHTFRHHKIDMWCINSLNCWKILKA